MICSRLHDSKKSSVETFRKLTMMTILAFLVIWGGGPKGQTFSTARYEYTLFSRETTTRPIVIAIITATTIATTAK